MDIHGLDIGYWMRVDCGHYMLANDVFSEHQIEANENPMQIFSMLLVYNFNQFYKKYLILKTCTNLSWTR